MKPLVFISYKHLAPWSEMARKLHLKLLIAGEDLDYEVYIDKEMDPAAVWRDELKARLDVATHFIALLCDEYWASTECRNELHRILERYEAAKGAGSTGPKLLFVRAGELNPARFTFDRARARGELSSDDPRLRRVGDLNFLGPFDLDNNGQLEILDWESASRLDRQLGQLRDRFEKTLPKSQ
jgi:hypothetical protein